MALIATLLLGVTPLGCSERAADSSYPGGKWTPPDATYDVSTDASLSVRASDGAILKLDVSYPTDPTTGNRLPGPFPVILNQDPYTEQPPADPAMVAARQRFFGLENVDSTSGAVRDDRVLMSWFGMASFAASVNGHVFLVDSYVNRFVSGMAYTGTTPEEVSALAPEAVLIGHLHFDHGGDIVTVIRNNPGITVAGTGEHCADLEAAVTDTAFTCVDILPAPSSLGQVGHDDSILPGIELTAVRHPHNAEANFLYTDPAENVPILPMVGCGAPPPNPNDPPTWEAPNSGQTSIYWQIRFEHFELGYQDTTGANDATGVSDLYEALPSPDVLFSPSVGGASYEIRKPIMDLQPKYFVPVHHDSPCGNNNRLFIERELAKIPEETRPKMLFISNPEDYRRPLSWDPASAEWEDGPVVPRNVPRVPAINPRNISGSQSSSYELATICSLDPVPA
jgi:hypothetical protein